jgi:alkylation response protein AidB-like acyl-CoA dehydrogenase
VVERNDGYRSRELAKLGLNDWSTAELVFDDVFVPSGRLRHGVANLDGEVLRDRSRGATDSE